MTVRFTIVMNGGACAPYVARAIASLRAQSCTEWEAFVTIDTTLLRPAEVDRLLGDASKAHERLNWHPTTQLPELMGIMVDADLERVRRAHASRIA